MGVDLEREVEGIAGQGVDEDLREGIRPPLEEDPQADPVGRVPHRVDLVGVGGFDSLGAVLLDLGGQILRTLGRQAGQADADLLGFTADAVNPLRNRLQDRLGVALRLEVFVVGLGVGELVRV